MSSLSQDVVEHAVAAYGDAVPVGFEPSAVAYAAGSAWAAAGHPERALSVWLDALALPSARGWPLLMNGVLAVAEDLGCCGQTASALSEHVDRLPELHLWMGVLWRQDGQLEQALRSLQQAQRLTEGELRFTATTERLRLLVALGRLEEAVVVARDAVRGQPDHATELGVSLGGLLNRLHRPNEALGVLASVLERAPGFAPAWLNQGSALWKLGRREAAQTAFSRAVALDPTLAGPAAAIQELSE